MKAKSWKKFIDKEKKEELFPPELPFPQDPKSPIENPLESAIEQNDTLKKLMAEREQLERKMGELTGETGFGSFAQNTQRNLGEIPSIDEKKKRDLEWEQQRKKTIALLKSRKTVEKEAPSGIKDNVSEVRSNVTPLEGVMDKSDLFQRLSKKKDSFDKKSRKVKEKVDDFEKRKEKAEAKLKAVKKGVKKVKDTFKSAQKELDKFDDLQKEFGSDSKIGSDITALKDRFGTGSKVDKKLDKLTESFNKKRGGEKLDQKWKKIKDKQKDFNRVKSKYEERKKKLLSLDRKSFEDLDEKRKKLQEKVMEKKRAERKEEEKREKRKEERKRQKKERF